MDKLEQALVKEVRAFFSDKAKNFCSKPGVGLPPAIDMDFMLYNYFQILLLVERNTAFFSIKVNSLSISIAKTELNNSDTEYLGKIVLSELDKEVRLRIPDKYLAAKGWL